MKLKAFSSPPIICSGVRMKTLLIIRFTYLLLFVACLQVSAKGNTRNSISEINIGLDIAIESTTPPITDLKGRVVNEKGEPVEGVTVTVKGKRNATTTSTNGEFVLSGVDKNATLVFSGVNVELFELKVDGKTNFGTISIKTKTTELAEVTITASTGYQTISKERAPGAFDVVGRDVLDKRPVSNISTALQGLVAGLQAKENLDGTMEFLIRGTSSLYSGRQPLVVVDGFPIIGTDFSNLNPNDVESITVLKDAAASSIWGARAANGVIVITTKKAKGR